MKYIASIYFAISFFMIFSHANAQESGTPIYTADFGVQMYSFRNIVPEIGLESTLDFIEEQGITLIEGGGIPEGFEQDEYINLLASKGISTPSIGAGFSALRDNIDEIIEEAKSVGATYVMCAWIDHEVGNFNFLNASEAVEVFNEAGKKLAENGLTFMYHFHGYELIPHREGTLLDYIMNNTNPDWVSFQMDVFWIQFGGGNPTHLLQKYGERWVSLHLKDMKKGTMKDHTGLTSGQNNVVIGTGEIDFVGVLKEAQKLGITYMFIEDESDDPLGQIPLSIEYLKSLRH